MMSLKRHILAGSVLLIGCLFFMPFGPLIAVPTVALMCRSRSVSPKIGFSREYQIKVLTVGVTVFVLIYITAAVVINRLDSKNALIVVEVMEWLLRYTRVQTDAYLVESSYGAEARYVYVRSKFAFSASLTAAVIFSLLTCISLLKNQSTKLPRRKRRDVLLSTGYFLFIGYLFIWLTLLPGARLDNKLARDIADHNFLFFFVVGANFSCLVAWSTYGAMLISIMEKRGSKCSGQP